VPWIAVLVLLLVIGGAIVGGIIEVVTWVIGWLVKVGIVEDKWTKDKEAKLTVKAPAPPKTKVEPRL
jgi:hypothetical protein